MGKEEEEEDEGGDEEAAGEIDIQEECTKEKYLFL